MNMIMVMLRTVMSVLDKGIYALLVMVYDLMNSIANTQLFSTTEGGVGIIFNNVYTILGVIMLFKLAFSLLTYVINPDAMSDKNNGMGSLIKNVVIVIALTLTVPIIFDKAMDLQRVVLKEDIIGRIVTGISKENEDMTDSSAGKLMATNVLAGFIKPDPELYPDCANMIFVGEDSISSCAAPEFNTYFSAVQAGDYKTLLSSDIVQAKNSDNKFVYDYMMLFTSLAGLAVAYILLLFCINIAVRSVKLIFLQLIAPIPIVSYIDPKGQKGMFNKWVSICIKTYMDLFIRLAGIYFALFLIQNVVLAGKLEVNGDKPGFFVNVFIIFGALLFAKELPKLIEELTGAKLSGGFNLNPMKTAASIPLIGGGLAAGMGLAGRTVKNIGGIGTGAIGLGAGAISNKFKDSSLGQKITTAKQGVSTQYQKSGFNTAMTSFGNTKFGRMASAQLGRVGADVGSTFGGAFASSGDKKLSGYKKITDAVSNMENRAKERIKTGGAGKLSLRYNREMANIDQLKNMSSEEWNNNPLSSDSQGNYISQTDAIATAQYKLDDWMNSNEPNGAVSEYIDNSINAQNGIGNSNDIKADATLYSMYSDYKAANEAAGSPEIENSKGYAPGTAAAMHSQMGKLKGKTSEINRSRIAAQEAKKK